MARKKKHNHKKKLTDAQEFELMRMILDKFLWLGIVFIGYGLYVGLDTWQMEVGAPYTITGLLVMGIVTVLHIKYFEQYT